jgi:hypothetical protein
MNTKPQKPNSWLPSRRSLMKSPCCLVVQSNRSKAWGFPKFRIHRLRGCIFPEFLGQSYKDCRTSSYEDIASQGIKPAARLPLPDPVHPHRKHNEANTVRTVQELSNLPEKTVFAKDDIAIKAPAPSALLVQRVPSQAERLAVQTALSLNSIDERHGGGRICRL